jgi:nucleotide-binding universal stress UspA family protein/mono/diheme cytochrome c family protein
MTLDIKRNLVPVDFSANSEIALDYAHAMARRFGAALHLVHVCEVPSMVTGSMDAYAIAYTEWSQRLGEEAEKELTRLQAAIGDVPVSTEVLFGNPARAIVSASQTDLADLIVMGTHGRGAMAHAVMGSVAEKVVRTATSPVLTVRERRDLRRPAQIEVKSTRTRPAALCAIGAAVFALLLPGLAAAQSSEPAPAPVMKQTIPGGELFRTYCVTCHGTTARGDGPLASSMTRKPADLTELAKRNGGVYPSELVFRTIDGKKPVRGHGGADMPVWGDAFARSRDVNNPAQVEKMIQSLVDYLESIQSRPVHEEK